MDQNTIQAPETLSSESSIKPFSFTGKGSEYFSIWIVNVCLTILTLGIYSAWAKVRTQQYFYGNTWLDNISFQYLANPNQILKGRIIAFSAFAAYYAAAMFSPIAALIILLAIMMLAPALLVLTMAFICRNSAYRNVSFNFQKDFKQAYKLMAIPLLIFGAFFASLALLMPEASTINPETPPDIKQQLIPLLSLLIFMLVFPWFEYVVTRFRVKNAQYGDTAFDFFARAGNYYKIYLFAFPILMLIVIGIIIVYGLIAGLSGALNHIPTEDTSGSVSAFSFVPLLFLPVYLWFFAYIQTKRTNLLFNNITVGDHKLRSELKTGDMLKLYITNTMAILLSLGLLMPWAKIRTAQYRASKTSLEASGNIDDFAAVQRSKQSAIGEEVGEIFDLGLGV